MPNAGDVVYGPDIGYKSKRHFRWDECPKCGIGRWVKRSFSNDRLCRLCALGYSHIVSRDVKVVRAQQLLELNKTDVLVEKYGHGQVNQVLRREFGSGLKAQVIADMANKIRGDNVLTHRTCRKCGKEQPIVEFQWGRTLQRICKHCKQERDRAYYEHTKDTRKVNRKRVYDADPEHVIKHVRSNGKIYDAVRKLRVISHYSNGKLACVHCGEDDMACLSIDHINGGGVQHRRIIGSHFYAWLIKNNFPKGYQTLCMNCQMKKKHNEEEFTNLEHIERRKVYGNG